MKALHPLFDEVIAAKRKLPHIDKLILDSKVDKHLKRWLDPKLERLTLGSALLLHSRNPHFLPVASSLELQLIHLDSKVYNNRRQTLANSLLNGDTQFLNTLSELALALELQRGGWEIELSTVFYRKKDVDIRASKNGDFRFVDVTNLFPETLDMPDGFATISGNIDPKLISKVADKYADKFEKAIASGWKGSPWIALDYGKKHETAIDLTLRSEILTQNWELDIAKNLTNYCAGLRGIVYYASSAECPFAYDVRWTILS